MDRPPTVTRADSTRRQTPTFQRPMSRPVSSRVLPSGGGAPRPAAPAAVRHKPISYDYATGSTFAVKINGKPVFLLNDFRKKVDQNVKGQRYVTAFKTALGKQIEDKKKQDAIRDQYDRTIVDRFRPVEHTETGLTKNLLGLGAKDDLVEPPPAQGEIGYSRIDQIDPWEDAANGGLEKYSPCVTSVFAPVQFQGLDDMHPQWQREPASHLKLDFVYGYQGASCWDQDLFGAGPGQDNLFFLQRFSFDQGMMINTGEIIFFTAATVVVFDVKNNIQRFFHHSDDVTAMTVLRRVYQKPDASWEEMMRPQGSKARDEWAKWFAYDKGVYQPSEKDWTPASRLLPQSNDEFPQMLDGHQNDWRDWDLPNRCIVASGQKGRNPRIFVWRVTRYNGESEMSKQVLATMTLGAKRLQVSALSFNKDGKYLLALAHDSEHMISVFDWRKGVKIRDGKGHGGTVDSCKFNPYSDSAFGSCGEKHLKFWELGETDFECAAGMFGDMGKPQSQRICVFNPKGNTISGVDNGDIYVWSSGTVSAKYEGAHKSEVLGLLFVDGVGLFSCGRGGMLKVWDPELRDTKKPLCCFDLRSLNVQGHPGLTNRISGRSMDWTTSADMLKVVDDDNVVMDEPAKGRCGAPATHLSLGDLGAEGILLLGTTTNSILMLGFKKTGAWVHDGLNETHEIEGHSSNSRQGPLSMQWWWDKPSVREYMGKYGSKAGHLPVACYWYQNFDEREPGYRPRGAGGTLGKCPWKLAVCGKKVCMRGHMSYVDSISPMPNERIFISASKDCTARLYNMNDQAMVDSVYVHKPARSSTWWSKESVNGPVGEEVKDGKHVSVFAIGHDDGSFSIYRTERTADEAENHNEQKDNAFHNPEDAFGKITLCCSNPLPRKAPPLTRGQTPSEQGFCVKYSPNGKYFAIGLGDNCIDVYRHALVGFGDRPARDAQREMAKQKALGFTDEEIERQDCFPYKRVGCCNDHSSAVTHFDFDVDSNYMRSVSQSNELLYCFIPSGKQVVVEKESSMRKWANDTCILGWTVKSIWAKGSLGSDVNSLDRSKNKVPPWASCHGGTNPAPYPYPVGYLPAGSTDPSDVYETNNYPGEGHTSSWGHHVCATGDDHGKVKLFRWPAFGFKQAFRSYVGHGSFVSQVRFSYDDDYLISAGGADMSIFQWRHVIPNKIYVQNLPDRKDQYGNYILNQWDLRDMLEGFFSRLLKVDSNKVQRPKAGVTRSSKGGLASMHSGKMGTLDSMGGWRSGDEQYDNKLQAAVNNIEHLSTFHRKKLIQTAMLQNASRASNYHDKSKGAPDDEQPARIPDRMIVSCTIFNSGAADESRFFPSEQYGCKISDRWATIVFRTKDDADDVVDLYGGKLALKHPSLFKDGLVHLYPLYQELQGEAGRAHEGYVPPVSTDPKNPSEIVKETDESDPFVAGTKLRRKWAPLGDKDYSDELSNKGYPHFLYVTAADPSESMLAGVLDEAILNGVEGLENEKAKAPDDVFPETKEDVFKVWQEENKQWALVQEWLMSDERYGCTAETNDFRNFNLWWEMQENQKKV